MFHPKDKIKLKNNNIIGTNNFTKSDLNSFKISMTKKSICNIKFIDINAQVLNSRISKQREKAMKKKNRLGMISKEWLNKYQNEIPCVIIQIIDITAKIIEKKDPSLISEDIMLEMGKIKSAFMASNYILILRNLCNFYKNNHDALIKNNILSNVKYAKDKCIIIVNDNNQFDNKEFVDNLSEITNEEIKVLDKFNVSGLTIYQDFIDSLDRDVWDVINDEDPKNLDSLEFDEFCRIINKYKSIIDEQ
jgi:hypothetical protein